jgi:hypothetical protein
MANSPEIRNARIKELESRLTPLVNSAAVPSGILVAPPMQSPSLDLARGVPTDPPLSRQGWREVYFSLHKGATRFPQAAAVAPVVTPMETLDSIETRAEQVRATGAIPLAIGHYHYHAPTDMFVNRMRNYVENGGPLPVADRAKPESVLQQKTAFFATPLLKQEYHLFAPKEPVLHGLTARFVVPSSLYLSNTGETPTRVEVDPGDGKGYRDVALDQPFDTTYANPGTKHIRIRVNSGGQVLYAATQIQAAQDAPPPFQEYWTLTSPVTYQGVTATGHAWVFYGPAHTAIVNPLIVAEGFPGDYPLSTLWSTLNEQNFATDILAKGYDLIVLGFDNGVTYVEANAGVAIAAIQKAIAERQGSTQLVVGGASMGGLVTRYALAYMETNGMNHQTRLYFSFDSPHFGAVVAASALYFASYFASESDGASQANALLTSTAAQEMLIYSLASYNTTPATPSALRTTLIANLISVGNMPQQCRKIGVANGTGNGVGNGVPPGAEMLTFSAWCAGASLYSAPGISQDSSTDLLAELRVGVDSSDYSWSYPAGAPCAFDGAPGGTDGFMAELASGLISAGYSPTTPYPTSCFMPSITSCALTDRSLYSNADLYTPIPASGEASLLDAYFYSDQNYQHVTVTPQIAVWLFQQIGNSVELVKSVSGD